MSFTTMLVNFGEDVWVNYTEVAAIVPHRNMISGQQYSDQIDIVLKSGTMLLVTKQTVAEALELWHEAMQHEAMIKK